MKLHTLICVDDLLSDARSMQKTKAHDDYDSKNEDEEDDHHVEVDAQGKLNEFKMGGPN